MKNLSVALLLLLPFTASADIVITEVMYDLPTGADSGREWIEVYNTGNDVVDLGKMRLLESATNHKMKLIDGTMLMPHSYAIIAADPDRFKADNPTYVGSLYDSVFSLGNTGDTLSLLSEESITIDTFTYQGGMGGNGDGNSLNRELAAINDIHARAPSPGASMSAEILYKKTEPKDEVVVTTNAPLAAAVEDRSAPLPDAQTAAAFSRDESGTFAWWSGALTLALATAAAVFAARRVQKKEWKVVEEE